MIGRGGRMLACLACAAAALPSVEDPLLAEAREALAAGDLARCQALVDSHPGGADDRSVVLLRARLLLAADRPAAAEELLAPLLEGRGDPEGERASGEAWELFARALLAGDGPSSRVEAALARAVASGDERVAVADCLVLLGECALALGRDALARRACERVWVGWRRDPVRWRAGLLLARLVAESEPARAQRILHDIAVSRAGAAIRGDAADLQCALLLARRPGSCLQVAEQALASDLPEPGRFHRWRALALAEIAPARVGDALDQVPPEYRDPLTERARRLVADSERATDPVAVAIQAVGSPAEAAALDRLALAAGDRPTAQVVLAWRGRPAQPEEGTWARVVRLQALAERDPDEARRRLAALSPPSDGDALGARVERLVPGLLGNALFAILAGDPDHPALADWRRRLRERPAPGVAVGMAWAWEARAREAAGDGEAPAAWREAAIRLPESHPWAAPAACAGARPLLQAVPPGTVLGDPDLAVVEALERACRLLVGPAWAGTEPDHLACRWLLAQALAQRGALPESRACLDALAEHADGARATRLERFRERLDAARETVYIPVQP